MNRTRRAAAGGLLIAAIATGCGEDADKPAQFDGYYRTELTTAVLQRSFPGTSAPAGRWTARIDTKLGNVEVGAPDGGGFSLAIKSIAGDRITFEDPGCAAADGSPAGDAVYRMQRDAEQLRFSKLRDRCADVDPETALLKVGTWLRDDRVTPAP